MTRWNIIAGLVIIILLFFGFFFRYQMQVTSDPTLVYKLNRLTGRLEFCRILEVRGGSEAAASIFDSLECGSMIEAR